MAKALTCPACGNSGEATIDDTGAFEVKGQFQGKAVRRCKKCGAGFLVGPFSGGFFGNPKLIPPILWERMRETWRHEFESDSRRQPISSSQVAQQLVEMTIASSSFEKISEAIQAVIQEAEKPSNIDDRMRYEWLILNMLAATYGVQRSEIQPDIKRNILDQFHYLVYHAEFPTDEERATFEQLVRDRYATYWAILDKQDANTFEEIGRSFSKEFMQSTDIILNLLVSKLFVMFARNSKTFVEDVFKKYELAL